jgi:hypothetical protein
MTDKGGKMGTVETIGKEPVPERITRAEVVEAQKTWGDGVVQIGRVFTAGGDYRSAAGKHVDTLYAFGQGQVLFKPTKAAELQFRNSRDGAISYFVAGDSKYPEDHGFALQPWSKVRFENSGIIEGPLALAMGNYFFTGPDGNEVKVEFTFGYKHDEKGNLRIVLHHSSLPYIPVH